jgi:hypothetical protein
MPLRADGFEPSAYAIPPPGPAPARKLCHIAARWVHEGIDTREPAIQCQNVHCD